MSKSSHLELAAFARAGPSHGFDYEVMRRYLFLRVWAMEPPRIKAPHPGVEVLQESAVAAVCNIDIRNYTHMYIYIYIHGT